MAWHCIRLEDDCLLGCLNMMEAASTCEMSVNFYQTTWRNIPDDSHLHTCCHIRLDYKCLMVHLYCHRCWWMAASRGGALLGDSLWNYIGNFCSEAFLGAMRGWWYIEGLNVHTLQFMLHLFMTNIMLVIRNKLPYYVLYKCRLLK
jgi:hypothetical protein